MSTFKQEVKSKKKKKVNMIKNWKLPDNIIKVYIK